MPRRRKQRIASTVSVERGKEPTIDQKRNLINAIKQEQGCFFCRERVSVCLEFHHVQPAQKRFAISEFRKHPWSLVLKEIAKCTVLCSNCHKKVHAGVLPPVVW